MTRKPLTAEQRERKLSRDRESARIWRANNPEKVSAKNLKFRQENPTVFSDYYKAHRDQCIESSRIWSAANPELEQAKSRRSYRIRKEQGKQVRGEDKDGARLRNLNRRALKKASGERIPKGFIASLLVSQRGKCAGCSTDIRTKYHADHIMPLAKGGAHTTTNLQLLCPTCNMTKHAKDPITWRQSIGQLL